MAPASKRGSTVSRDLALLIGRLALGAVFLAHGYQKVVDFGIAGVTQSFEGMGVPMAQIAAPVVSYVELVGGALLILGAFTPVVGLALAIDMLVAALLVHVPQGVFVDQGGWELVGALGAGALILAAVGPGRLSADALVLRRGRGRRSRSSAASTAAA
ncbi:DoxX family protein [Brachybacterium hainanense]|uniref:DoxX family protein n=1 Tax=Brachybacterium hainanense TaxID=1541174 RepID=A0ABV6RFW6_9MICO